MAKFYGKIGYALGPVETTPGVWSEGEIVEHSYTGDILQFSIRSQSTDKVNDDIALSNRFSILADPFANENIPFMKYVEYLGAKWKITSVEPAYPRLILTVGGVYHE